MIQTIVQCDCGCGSKLDLGGPDEKEVQGADELLEITDANRKKYFFLTADCLRKWAAKYVSPYKRPEPTEFIPLDAILPGSKAN